MDDRYPLKLSPYSSHSQLLKFAGDGDGRQVLDIGCADGSLAQQLEQRGWRVIGIEPDKNDANKARVKGFEIHEMTLEESLTQLAWDFDALVLGDVLEHCADPWELLHQMSSKLSPACLVLISIPNVAHLSVRLLLMFGRFEYTDRGILDRTHLKFFTKKTASAMINSSGLEIVDWTTTPVPLELLWPRLPHSHLGKIALLANQRIAKFFPKLFAYQFVFKCKVVPNS